MSADAGADRVSKRNPTLVMRAVLVCTALLPWFAVFSGTFSLYFYVILAATLLAEWLLIPVLVLAEPLAVLLLLVMPAGAIYTAARRPPGGWAGRLTRGGCLASMGFPLVYSGLLAGVTVAEIFREGAGAVWEPFLAWRIAVLILGLWATERARRSSLGTPGCRLGARRPGPGPGRVGRGWCR